MIRSILSLSLCFTMSVLAMAQETEKKTAAPAADKWEKEISELLAKDEKSPPRKNGIVFTGSSSIKRWDLAKSFPNLPVVNRGFGGSQIHDATKYATKIVTPLQP